MRRRGRSRAALLVTVLAALGLAGNAGQAGAQPRSPGAEPQVSAPAAIVVEGSTGRVAFARDADIPRPVASATKLMTALLALESLAPDELVAAAPYDADPAESVIDLRTGELLSVRDLLAGLLVASANDAAETLAVRIAGSRVAFVAEMNRRAGELGLDSTHYSNPIGLDEPGNYSSPADLVRLTRLLRRSPLFRALVDGERVTLQTGDRERTLETSNDALAAAPAVNGVKTGFTREAGNVLVGSATLRGVTVISVVAGAPSEQARDDDTLALLRHGLRSFRAATFVRRGAPLAAAAVANRERDSVELVADRSVRRVVRADERARLEVVAPAELEGPLPAATPVGGVAVVLGGETIARVRLMTGDAVPEIGLPERIWDRISEASTLALLAALAAAFVALAALRRRSSPTPAGTA